MVTASSWQLASLSSEFSSVQSLSRVRLFVTSWIAARQASLSITNSWSLLKLMSIESVMPCSHLILCRPLLLLPPIPPSIRVFSNESSLHEVAKVPVHTMASSVLVRGRMGSLLAPVPLNMHTLSNSNLCLSRGQCQSKKVWDYSRSLVQAGELLGLSWQVGQSLRQFSMNQLFP